MMNCERNHRNYNRKRKIKLKIKIQNKITKDIMTNCPTLDNEAQGDNAVVISKFEQYLKTRNSHFLKTS